MNVTEEHRELLKRIAAVVITKRCSGPVGYVSTFGSDLFDEFPWVQYLLEGEAFPTSELDRLAKYLGVGFYWLNSGKDDPYGLSVSPSIHPQRWWDAEMVVRRLEKSLLDPPMNGCKYCGTAKHEHYNAMSIIGSHLWTAPSDAVRKKRLLKKRNKTN